MDIFSDTTGEKYLYRYRPDKVYAIDEILNHYIRFSDKKSLNDVFEFYFGGISDFKHSSIEEKTTIIFNIILSMDKLGIEHKYSKEFLKSINDPEFSYSSDILNGKENEFLGYFQEVINKGSGPFEKHLENVLISCFCKKPLNAIMMGHYCNRAKGVVIAYKRNFLDKAFINTNLYDVIYSNHPYKIGVLDYLGLITGGDSSNYRNDLLARKQKQWAYEDEVRAILPNLSSINKNIDIGSDGIAGVCFNPNASKSFIKVVINVCAQKSIPVFECSKKSGSYELEANLFDINKLSHHP